MVRDATRALGQTFVEAAARAATYPHLGWGAALLLGVALFVATDSAAQTLVGFVLEEGRNTPVAGAKISLVDQDGERRADAMSDSLGHFQLAPPEPGEYVVEAAALGYEPANSPLFAMTIEGSVPFDFALRPNPIGLEGLDVSVEPIDVVAERLLQGFGLTIDALGSRWIDREEIEKRSMNKLSGIVRWQGIPGVRVLVGNTPSTESLCVIVRERGCALTLLNGVEIDNYSANQIEPEAIEAMAILRPMDATTFFGSRGNSGVVLLWTR